MDTPNEVGRHGAIECRCGAAETRQPEVVGICECGPGCACGLCDCAK